ncbi:histidine kinase [Ralstonia solanacearum]|nr:histidine kinase [Ralstonia solanacearum]
MISFSILRREFRVSRYRAGLLIGMVWTATITVALLLLYLGFDSYNRAKERLMDQAVTYAHLIAEHDRFGFQLADVVLKDVMEDLNWEDFNGPIVTSPRRDVVYRRLMRHKDRFPGIASFTIVGADGIRRLGIVNRDGTDLSSRGYFKELKQGKELFISRFENGLASGKPGIHVARRFSAANGEFGGVLVMNLAAQEVFFPFYKETGLGPGTKTSLRDNARILISFPASPGSSPGQYPRVGDRFSQRVANGEDHGTFTAVDPEDGEEKITAFEELGDSGIYATVSLPIVSAMSGPTIAAIASLSAAVALVFGAIGIGAAIKKAGALSNAMNEATEAGEERRRLIRRLNTAIEDERKHIAIEVHDVINAISIGIRLDAQAILSGDTSEQDLPSRIEKMRERARSIVTRANDLYASCRTLVVRLRPEVLDILGLGQAIEEMVMSYNTSDPRCEFCFVQDGNLDDVDPGIAIAMYRIVQEALSNIVKHAKAKHATVSVRVLDGELRLEIVDDGRGFDEKAEFSGFGIIGMRERAASFGGVLEIKTNKASGGTALTVRVPLINQ